MSTRRQTSPSESLADAFYDALTGLLRLYQFRDRNRIRLSGITASEAYVLDALARLGPSWITHIGRELQLNKRTISRLVDTLDQEGFVERRADRDNHRATRVALTEKGQEKHREMVRQIKGEYAAALSGLSDGSVAEMIETLENIRKLARRRMEKGTAASP